MRNKRKIIIIFGIVLSILLAAGGTYAVWVWISDVDKNLVMNTMSGLDNNIIYDDGEAKFIGDFSPTDKFCQSEYNTISFYKTGELEIRDVNATIYMEVAAIGLNIAASNDVYWVLTEGDNTINCDDMLNSSSVVASGNFNGFSSGQSIKLLGDISVTTIEQKFTIWIWIDSAGSNLSSLSGETIHANVWTEFEVLGRTKYVVNLDPNGGILNTSAVLKEYNNYGSYVYSAPYTGEYILEVWGAQGGSYNDTYHGGYGGYSVGNISLNENQQLHVNVGGSGSGGYVTAYEGGYNGGGSTKASANTNVYNSSGGGATHIATKIGVLSSLSSDTSSILIVAGGGGGAHYHSSGMSAGGSGGGITGGSPTNATMVSDKCIAPTGGTQTTAGINYNYNSSAGSFGLGGNYKDRYGGGGGGGYYGGASGGNADNCAYSGAGGSGYIGNSLLTNKVMYCYNCDISTDVNTLTYTTTNVSETAISNYAKRGTGAARITFKNSLLVRYADKYENLPIPTREGYEFLGWFTELSDGIKVDNNTKMSMNENHTLYAHWKEYE